MTGIALEIAVLSFGSWVVDSALLKAARSSVWSFTIESIYFLSNPFPDIFESFAYSVLWSSDRSVGTVKPIDVATAPSSLFSLV
jgi:hypothetical protein